MMNTPCKGCGKLLTECDSCLAGYCNNTDCVFNDVPHLTDEQTKKLLEHLVKSEKLKLTTHHYHARYDDDSDDFTAKLVFNDETLATKTEY